MTIIYVISSIILFILVVLLKKKDKEQEIIKALTITIIIQLAYNALVCYMLNLLNIPITVINLSIVNYIVSAIMLIIILVNKQIQKYRLERKNIAIVAFFVLLSIVVLAFILKGEAKIRYLTGDPQNHYTATRGFTSNVYLSNNYEKNYYITPDFMIMGYANEGIICKILSPYIGTIALFNIYLIFEVIIYALVGINFYFLAQKYCKNKYQYAITLIFSLFYILGYPLNAWITGFHYLVIGILYIQAILYAINEIKIQFKYELILMFLLNFGLIFSYCLFCPAIYLAEFIYYIYKYFNKDNKKLILIIAIALIIPGIMGTSYILMVNLKGITKTFALEGYIYKNLWSNFIIFIPFAIYNIYKNIKNRKVTIDVVMLVTLIIYMILLHILKQNGKCSDYYFSKNYFVLWILIIEMAIKGITKFSKSGKYEKTLTFLYTIIYIIIFGVCVYFIRTPQRKNANDNLSNVMEIFTFNNTMIQKDMGPILKKNEYKLFLKVEKIIKNNWKECSKNNAILFITDKLQDIWIGCLTGYSNDILKNELNNNEEELIKNIENNIYTYIVITKNTEKYEKYYKYIKTNELNLIYEDDTGIIYQKY